MRKTKVRGHDKRVAHKLKDGEHFAEKQLKHAWNHLFYQNVGSNMLKHAHRTLRKSDDDMYEKGTFGCFFSVSIFASPSTEKWRSSVDTISEKYITCFPLAFDVKTHVTYTVNIYICTYTYHTY